LTINFEALLREKLMSNDAQLSINYHRIEQKQANDIRILMERITQLEEWVEVISNAEICLFNNGSGTCIFCPVNTEELKLNGGYNYIWNKIQYFVKLLKLEIQCATGLSKLTQFKNKNVKELSLASMPPFNSFTGLAGFPNLHTLSVTACII
jgi:Leucine-rich repeat (LRR) protein